MCVCALISNTLQLQFYQTSKAQKYWFSLGWFYVGWSILTNQFLKYGGLILLYLRQRWRVNSSIVKNERIVQLLWDQI